VIIDLLVVAGIAAGVAASAGALGALRAARARAARAAPKVADTLAAAIGPRGPRGLRERDVVTYGREEVLLEAGLELEESGLVVRAFRALGIARVEWVLQLDVDARDVVFGRACAEVPAGAIPEALIVDGRTVRVRRRGTAKVRATGSSQAPFDRVVFAVLDERGGRVLVVIDPQPTGERIAIVGERLDTRTFDVLPGGDVPE
jgi:hypothetical protein